MFNEVDVLVFQIVHRGPGGVRWRSILLQCPPVMTTLQCCIDYFFHSNALQLQLLGSV